MFIYQPTINSGDRVAWYGGESSQIYYEVLMPGVDGTPDWIGRHVRTLGGGIPAGMSELHAELVEYYNYCQATDLE
jgi:hypothetical protein